MTDATVLRRPAARELIHPARSAREFLKPEIMRGSDSRSLPSPSNVFQTLAARWRAETRFSSSIVDIVMNDAYQQIIGLGLPAVPLILEELRKRPGHWYWALGAITRADPAKDVRPGDIQGICDAWLDWGRKNGLVAAR